VTREYTDPSVLQGIANGASWADPETDPTRIDWAQRQADALIPFKVTDGRPVNPCQSTGIRYGRNLLGHWGEQPCADAIVTAQTTDGRWHLLMVERADGHGWAVPGGYLDQGEQPMDAALRELAEETGLILPAGTPRWERRPRYVPDPRASDEAWMVTVPVRATLGRVAELPAVIGQDDARRAAWVPADTYYRLVEHLLDTYVGEVFAAHRQLLADVLTD